MTGGLGGAVFTTGAGGSGGSVDKPPAKIDETLPAGFTAETANGGWKVLGLLADFNEPSQNVCANVLRTMVHRGTSHRHPQMTVASHSHSEAWLVARPILVGMVHGLAGSAPLLLLTLTVVSSPLPAFFYIGVFGVGSMMGMSIMSLLLGVPARLTVEHFARTHLALRGLSGLFSVAIGLFIVYENSVLNRLSA